MNQAHAYLDRACTIMNLFVAAISIFLELEEVASISDIADSLAYTCRRPPLLLLRLPRWRGWTGACDRGS